MNQPMIKFYPRDWIAEYKLRLVKPEDRGNWIDLLCLMAMAEPYGYLMHNGRAFTDDEICKILQLDPLMYLESKNRLIEAGVCSQDNKGVLFSRRLVRDYQRRQAAVESGKAGGNPSLLPSPEKKKEKKDNHNHSHSLGPTPPLSHPLTPPLTKDTESQVVEFEQFWKLYPRKTSRQDAIKAFKRKQCAAKMNLIIKALEQQNQSDQWQRGIIPHPSTWLNQERWLDEPLKPTQRQSLFSNNAKETT